MSENKPIYFEKYDLNLARMDGCCPYDCLICGSEVFKATNVLQLEEPELLGTLVLGGLCNNCAKGGPPRVAERLSKRIDFFRSKTFRLERILKILSGISDETWNVTQGNIEPDPDYCGTICDKCFEYSNKIEDYSETVSKLPID